MSAWPVLERENAELRAELVAALDGQAAAVAEAERLAASQCQHPAGAVDGGRCHACGTELW